MTKKNLNPEDVVNELKGQSVFFGPQSEQPQSPTQSQSNPKRKKKAKDANARTPERPYPRTGERANTRTGERPIKRHSFNFFADQIEALVNLEKARGERGAMSGWVRQAIDEFLEKQSDEESERPNGRTGELTNW